MQEANRVSSALMRRLPRYFRYLQELERRGVTRISSQELARRMRLTASQIRQDINCFGGEGQQGYGYVVVSLRERISRLLGLGREYSMVIVGAGNLGQALSKYNGFGDMGFKVRALFDINERLAGLPVYHYTIRPVSELAGYLSEHKTDIGVITVPAEHAQATCDALARGGVGAVWNFAPLDLRAPEGVSLENMHLSDSLLVLSYKLTHQ